MKNKNRVIWLLLATVATFSSRAEILNGDFESWSSGSPSDWTTIDSGINVNQNNAITRTNASSAAITVNTGSQSSTDFRQVINVVNGQTYSFSTWIYHTEGGVRARFYVDGFRNYSSPSTTNQWQQLTYNYTASSTKNISVGLRFYDTAGFDGSETVYVDDFQPTTSAGGGGNAGCQDIQLTLITDNYANETSWRITDSNQTSVASGSSYQNNTSNVETSCLSDGDYTFTIDDSFGDGICCAWGNGSYDISVAGSSLISGGSFASTESKTFTIGTGNGGGTPPPGGGSDAGTYYDSITTQSGFTLKTALYNLINNHVAQGYSAIWGFYAANSLDIYYENDGSILDIYSERPNASDSYSYTKIVDQCGTFRVEGECYNREHSFPRSWFGGAIEPMNSDIHHIFATDGSVNGTRSSFPYGAVGSASVTSSNGSKLGSSITFGYSGTVFEPIDEFKGDVARAYFYLATRYQNVIGSWQGNTASANAVLNGSSAQVFETWQLNLLKSWHAIDPVSQMEIDRNNASHLYQGNRNPFVDHPEYVDAIWN